MRSGNLLRCKTQLSYSFPDLRSHASFWVFIKSASERRELKRNSSVPFPARQWERVLDLCHLRFHSLRLRADNNALTAGSMFRVHQWRRQCTFQVKVCSSCYWLALLRVGWPGSLWQVAGLVSSPISQLELLVL